MALLGLAAFVRPAHAQQPVVRTLDEQQGSRTVEITVDWKSSLRAVLDSADVQNFGVAAINAAVSALTTADELLTLPTLAAPQVSVLASDFEEVSLPGGPPSVADTVIAGALAEAVGLGWFRKKPVASLLVRLLQYDAGAQRLVRYRRVVVRITYAADEAGSGRQLRASSNPHLAVTRSVLADGTVFRVPVTSEGVYKIDRDFIAKLGLNPAATDPARVAAYGNGGAPLPALNSASRIADLAEIAVKVQGGGDGSFDAGDAVYVYTRGVQGWTYDSTSQSWTHYTNPFATESAFFIKIKDAPAQQVGVQAFPGVQAPELTQTVGRHIAEFDEFNWTPGEAGSGLIWWTRTFGASTPRTLLASSDLPGLASGTISYVSHAAVRSVDITPAASLRFEAAGSTLLQRDFGTVSTRSQTATSARARVVSFNQAYSGNAFTLQARVVEGAPNPNTPIAAVDWVRTFYPQNLTATNGYLRFATPPGQTGSITLAMTGFTTEPQVWDVTDPVAPVQLGVQSSGSLYRVQVVAAERPREIVAFTATGVRAIETVARRVQPQNLHGLTGSPDLAIVVPDTFRVFAESLADIRRQQGLEVVVASVREIYNEFSGGVPDMRAVRDYFKFVYDRAPDDDSRLRYGLLFGDGHFDYRGIGRETVLNNWIFPYETEESLDELYTYASDDYFGVLDDAEGVWRDNAFNERVDIGIGRLPVQNLGDARAVIDKMARYESPQTFGEWRTRYLFVADDGPTPSDNNSDLHVQNADFVAELVKSTSEQVKINKIYGPSYERVFQVKHRLPGARRDILRAIEDGILAFNYSGHGGPEVLADEEIFTKDDAEALQNLDKLPVFVTATCSFGRYDMEARQSAAEVLVLNPRGGAVAMFTTIRVVQTSSSTVSLNVGVNRYLNLGLFTRDAEGLPPRLGDAMLRLKQSPIGSDSNSRKFNLLGDPSLRFGLPPLNVAIDEIAGVAVDTAQARLRALDRVAVKGRVLRGDQTVATDYNGRVNVAVFDSERRVMLPYVTYMPTPYYLQRNDLIWRGSVEVTGGLFEATFVVPKDISYSNQAGLVTAYATSAQSHAAGSTQRVVVGGSVPQLPDDSRGPSVRLFLNDTTFVSGSVVPAKPELIVRLSDETGINTAGTGVGHEMLLVVNGDESKAVDIGSFFQADPGAYASGEVRYVLDNVPQGPGTVRVRAWDVLNNSGEAALDFVVTSTDRLDVQRVINFPNPMVSGTQFVFEHNQPLGTPATVQIRVYTLTGRPVRTLDDIDTLPSGVLGAGRVQVRWDGLDEDGDRLGAGVYLYKVRVEVERDDGTREVAERIERLAVVR